MLNNNIFYALQVINKSIWVFVNYFNKYIETNIIVSIEIFEK